MDNRDFLCVYPPLRDAWNTICPRGVTVNNAVPMDRLLYSKVVKNGNLKGHIRAQIQNKCRFGFTSMVSPWSATIAGPGVAPLIR